jgi:phytoene synthase
LLDLDYINRAAPPGSMRYFALLYAPREQRELLTALFVIDAEIRISATQVAHEVAHTRLQWWRAEVDRLINRSAQHPATQVVQAALPTADLSVLHELLVAADMDVARMTYNTATELTAYLERSGGVIFELLTGQRDYARHVGAFVRRVETLRDLAIEARAGRVYWALDDLDQHQVPIATLHANAPSPATNSLIAAEIERLRLQFAAMTPASRPMHVFAQLHAKLLDTIERADFNVFAKRHELGAIEKAWTAWRGARRS